MEISLKAIDDKYTIDDLIHIISILRSPNGCPWDREQTHETLKKAMIEEAYEAVEAIELHDLIKLEEELGDVLLQVIFHCQLATEYKEFEFIDVTDHIARKMISRHSHVFGKVIADTSEQVLDNWEVIKLKQKGLSSLYEDLKDVPSNFPALMRAAKISKKIYKSNVEEKHHITNAIDLNSHDFNDISDIGQLLYTICSKAAKCGIDPEMALKEFTETIIEAYKE